MVKKYGAQLTVFLFLLLAGCEENGPAQHPPLKLDPLKAGFLWKATYGDNAAYFFGTIPIGVSSMHPLPDTVYAVLDSADSLYFPGIPSEQQDEYLRRTRDKDRDEDQSIEGKEGEYRGLSNYYKNELIDIIGRRKYDRGKERAYEPYWFTGWVIARQLEKQPFLFGQDTIETIEKELSPLEAIKRKKKKDGSFIPRRQLGDVDYEVAVALLGDDLSPADQIDQLKNTLDDFELGRERIKKLIEPYKEGQGDTIRYLLREDRQKAKTTFVAGRSAWDWLQAWPNEIYAREIARILSRTGTEGEVSFVALPVSHWIVEDSDNVIEELKRILPGVTVEQLDLEEFYDE